MIDTKLLLFMILQQLGGLRLLDFDDRLVLQKRIYLLQEAFGFPVDYGYSWYVRGPYSAQLTEEAFRTSERSDIQEESKSVKLTDEALRIIERYQEFEKQFQGMPLPLSLELAASIHYLMHTGFLPGSKDKDNIASSLRQRGKDFTNQQFQAAWEALDKFGLLSKKTTS